MAFALPNLLLRITDANGTPIPGGGVYVFLAGTVTPVTTYSDNALTVPQASPVVADSGGKIAAMFIADGTYKVRVVDAIGATVYEIDNYVIATSGSGATFLNLPTSTKTANYTVLSSDRGNIILVDASGVGGLNIVISANSATLTNGFPVWIINSGAAGTVTIQGSGGQTINNAANLTLQIGSGVGISSIGAGGWRVFSSDGGIYFSAVTFTGPLAANGSISSLEQTLVVTSNIAAWNMANGPDAFVTNGAALTMAAPTGVSSGMRGKLRMTNSGGSGIALTWNAAFAVLPNSGALLAVLPVGTTYFEYWVSGTTIYVSRVPMNGALIYTVTNATASGTNSDFVVPAWAKRITLLFNTTSTSGTSRLLVQGGAGSADTTGYTSDCTVANGGVNAQATNGFIVAGVTASGTHVGHMTMMQGQTSLWIEENVVGLGNVAGSASIGFGIKNWPSGLTLLRITSVSGDTFNGGSVTMHAEA